MADRENNYIERHRHWQDQAINQLSTANNFMLTISIGLLAFCFDKNVFFKMKFCLCSCEINWPLTLHFFSLLFLTIAIMYGMAVLITRLYDFRITRNISLTRQRFYTENEKKITDENPKAALLPATEFPYPSFRKRINAIFKVIFIEIDLLTKLFKEHVGVTPKEFLKVIRFQKAIQQIENQISVDWSHIAFDCGFYDQSHFIADFKGFSGFTPSEYMKQRGDFLNYIPVK